MIDKQLPVILKGSKYAQRLPIGQKAVIDTFKYETATNFYNKWYRPELMAVITVGDFEKPEIEKLIKQYFSIIPKSQTPTKRPLFPVPDHNETLFAIASDPEAPYSYGSLIFKFDKEKKLGYSNLENEKLINKLKQIIYLKGASICELIMDPNEEQIPKAINKRTPEGKTVPTKLEDMYPFLSKQELNSNNY